MGLCWCGSSSLRGGVEVPFRAFLAASRFLPSSFPHTVAASCACMAKSPQRWASAFLHFFFALFCVCSFFFYLMKYGQQYLTPKSSHSVFITTLQIVLKALSFCDKRRLFTFTFSLDSILRKMLKIDLTAYWNFIIPLNSKIVYFCLFLHHNCRRLL